MKIETSSRAEIPGSTRESIVEQTPALAQLIVRLSQANAPDVTRIALSEKETEKHLSIAGALRRRLKMNNLPFSIKIREEGSELFIVRQKKDKPS